MKRIMVVLIIFSGFVGFSLTMAGMAMVVIQPASPLPLLLILSGCLLMTPMLMAAGIFLMDRTHTSVKRGAAAR